MIFLFPVLLIILLITQSAYAYVGPGFGAGTIGAALGLVGSILLALFAIIYYPIKRALKKFKAKQQTKQSTDLEAHEK